MAGQLIDRDKLGVLTKIGQGVVYGAPDAKAKFAPCMDYEEPKAQTLASIDFTALAAISALVEDSLSYAADERLISVAASPCAILENGGAPPGFVRPAIPAEFFISLPGSWVKPMTAFGPDDIENSHKTGYYLKRGHGEWFDQPRTCQYPTWAPDPIFSEHDHIPLAVLVAHIAGENIGAAQRINTVGR
ncbi:MAG: hypothetical protein WB785_22855 [Mycobacterium sp.]|uniref:hypothetical protein n=1 Tax=Mycobacterium sp. TaxID=1785 RepID=UPI003C3DC544